MSENASQIRAVPTTVYPWEEFVCRLKGHWPYDGAQKAFSHFTGFTESQVQHWRRTNSVPLVAVTAISEMPSTPDQYLDTQRGTSDLHSAKFISRVIELSNEGWPRITLAEMARKLSKEFSFEVTESMVKGVRFRNKELITDYQPREKVKRNAR